ncbi:MAG: DUF4386 domain-containing protein [Aurantibacter sp.]
MEPTRKSARIAGIFYLILIVSGIFSLMYVPSQLIEWEDASKTVNNITRSQLLWKLGIISNLICFTCFILLPLALYRLLKPVNKTHAALMVILAITSVPISYLNIANHIDVLSLINNAEYLEFFTVDQLNIEVMSLLESYNNGNMVAHIFWGLWLFPFGYLVYKSGFLPKFLGIMLMLGCFGYLIDFIGYFLFEGYGKTLFATIVGIPSSIGELGICLWLLIVGIKAPKIKS